ncbi:tetratricopeptide repeat protein [Helicobacter pylori]|uniref:tetratricopeptide repeat protein n=1 Tax=Helicobacter pylori TaxID=210 RepID=UPI001F0975A5|nr:tetratricopeptide repeat protein [Helicobacter pylori]
MFVLIGGGLMAEPNPEELVLLGIKSYEKQDFSKAKGYFEKACDLKDGRGCDALGVLYRDGQGAEKNLTKASQYFSKACDLNNNKGCFNLGALYLEKDSKKAAALFEKACKLRI